MINKDVCSMERHWQALTLSSNAFFDANDFEKALSNYERALTSAESLNNRMADCIRLDVPFMQVYIISCTNLANTYEALGELEYADRMFKRVVYYLLHLQVHVQLDQNEIRSELKRATFAYLQFAGKTGVTKQKRAEFFSRLKKQLSEGSENIKFTNR